MRKSDKNWYRHFDLGLKSLPFTRETEKEVDFIIWSLGLSGGERILDLGCGYGRHALSLACRGYDVTGVDISRPLIDDAKQCAREAGINVKFICSDIRDLHYGEAYDVVLNLAEGAIGYLENDHENAKIFDVIAHALHQGGKHLMHVCSGDHARAHFPKRNWLLHEDMLEFSNFDWDADTRTMFLSTNGLPFGQIAKKPDLSSADAIRLYTLAELTEIFKERGMNILQTFTGYDDRPWRQKDLEIQVISQKQV